ncbi:MAG: outer membrane protein assembly factor BamD [Candidatus Omnitrophica bacterium]|nr:outer membrane protein assembly factor BamD [Candidatus Omnitrophota bacterium]
MKKILFFLIICFFVQEAHAFWIWSPKTKKWKNPELSALATPKFQLDKAMKWFEAEKYKVSVREFRKVLIHYPDSREAAEAQYYLGRCRGELKKPYQAFLEYQKVIDTYPNSQRIQEIIERMYNIGEYYLNREPTKWLGMDLSSLTEHPSIEIFKKIIDAAPYSEYAPQVQYKLGLLFISLSRFEDASDIFQKLIDNYPENKWAKAAKYQLAISASKASPGVDYDDTRRKQAIDNFNEFVEKYPEADFSANAQNKLRILKEKEAKKNFDIACFYERQKKIRSAVIYYEIIVNDFGDTSYAKKAKESLLKLKPEENLQE